MCTILFFNSDYKLNNENTNHVVLNIMTLVLNTNVAVVLQRTNEVWKRRLLQLSQGE